MMNNRKVLSVADRHTVQAFDLLHRFCLPVVDGMHIYHI